MKTIDDDLQWADPLDIALDEHPPPRRRRPPATSVPSPKQSRPTAVPSLTLLAAGAAVALSVAALIIAVIAFGTVPTGAPTSRPAATALVADDIPAANPPAAPVVSASAALPEGERAAPRAPYDCTVSPRHATRCE